MMCHLVKRNIRPPLPVYLLSTSSWRGWWLLFCGLSNLGTLSGRRRGIFLFQCYRGKPSGNSGALYQCGPWWVLGGCSEFMFCCSSWNYPLYSPRQHFNAHHHNISTIKIPNHDAAILSFRFRAAIIYLMPLIESPRIHSTS